MFKRMMKNTAMKVQFVEAGTEPPIVLKTNNDLTFRYNPADLAEVGSEFITKTAVTVGIVYSGVKFLNTVCNVVELAARAKFK